LAADHSKQVEDELRESEARYRALAESSPLAIFVNRNDQVILANPACVRLFGASSSEELIGREALELFDPDSRALVRERIRVDSETVPLVEVRIVRLDGTTVDVEATASPFLDQGVKAIQILLRDITERKQAEEELRESEARYRALAERSPLAVFVSRNSKDDDSVVLVNPACVALFGASSAEELIGRSALELFDPDSRALVRGPIREATSATVPFTEAQIVRLDGTPVDVDIAAAPLLDQGIPATQVVLRNITELKRAHEQAARLAAVITSSPDAILTNDLDTTITNWNPAAEALYGYAAQEIIGTNMEVLVPAERRGEQKRLMKRLLKGEKIERFETQRKRKDGSLIDVSLTLFPIRNETGDTVAISVMAQDITERKEAQDALAQSEGYYRTLLQSANDGIYVFDVSPEEGAGAILDVNEEACSMLGYTRDELLAIRISDIDPSGGLTPTLSDGESLLTEGRGTFETTHKAKDGRLVPVEVSVSSFVFHGRPAGLSTVRDITERKRAEEKLVSSARVLKTLSRCNEALVRAEDEQTLLADVCEVGVEQGGYRMVWAGYAQDDEAKSVKPVAFAGHEDGFLSVVRFNWGDEDAWHNGPPGMAIRTGESVVVNHMGEDPLYAPSKVAAEARGYASVAAFPLIDSQQHAFGAIMFIRGRRGEFQNDEMDLLRELASDLAYGIEALRAKESRDQFEGHLILSNERLRDLMKAVVESLSRVVETRDPYTQGHEARVARLTKAIAGELEMAPDDIEGIEVAALVHDVGKMGVPAEVLTKPGALTDLEFQLIKQHSQMGYEILKDIDFGWPVAEAVLQHHERLDGSGYPRGLKGDEIIRGARVLAVADVVEAMATHPPVPPGAQPRVGARGDRRRLTLRSRGRLGLSAAVRERAVLARRVNAVRLTSAVS